MSIYGNFSEGKEMSTNNIYLKENQNESKNKRLLGN